MSAYMKTEFCHIEWRSQSLKTYIFNITNLARHREQLNLKITHILSVSCDSHFLETFFVTWPRTHALTKAPRTTQALNDFLALQILAVSESKYSFTYGI